MKKCHGTQDHVVRYQIDHIEALFESRQLLDNLIHQNRFLEYLCQYQASICLLLNLSVIFSLPNSTYNMH